MKITLDLEQKTIDRLENGSNSPMSMEMLGMDLHEAWEKSEVSPIDELRAAIDSGMNPSDFYDFACQLLKNK